MKKKFFNKNHNEVLHPKLKDQPTIEDDFK